MYCHVKIQTAFKILVFDYLEEKLYRTEQNRTEILLQVSRQQRMDDDLSVEEPPR